MIEYLFEKIDNIAGHECFVAKNRSKTPNVILLIKNVGKIKKTLKTRFYFKIKNVKIVFNIYGRIGLLNQNTHQARAKVKLSVK